MHDDRGHGFDPHGMVHFEHDDLSNLVHLVDGFVDLSAGYVLAPGFDHVFLMHCSSTNHSFSSDQRHIGLAITHRSTGSDDEG